MTDTLELGRTRDAASSPVSLPGKALLRHMMALGSSGSGKTVLSKIVVEEMVRQGVPALVLDPQGDLCSLALAADDPDALAERGLDPDTARAFAEQADVVVFTPASDHGIALGADPLAALVGAQASDDQPDQPDEQLWSRAAGMIAALLGYESDDDDGQGFIAVLDTILRDLAQNHRAPHSLAALTEQLAGLDDNALRPYAKFWDIKKIRGAIQKLARLEVGPRRRLFSGGVPLDIDVLLGRTGPTKTPRGKTRIAVIYLNTLHTQEDKEFLVAAIAERLYAWMLANPSSDPQVLFYLDEIAPYMPPVRKPQCKDSLQLLFKQARKYGVCCLMATQNPGDVDYRAMAQFGTWALGRLTTRQDLKKVEPTIKALAPADCDAVMGQLPRLEPGQFVLLSPDNLDAPTAMQSRWLYTAHQTLDDRRIAELADERWRERFSTLLESASSPAPTPKRSGSKAESSKVEASKIEASESKPAPAKRASGKSAEPKPASKKKSASSKRAEPKAESPGSKPQKPRTEKPEPDPLAPATAQDHHAELTVLRTHGPIDAKRLAELLGCSESRARRVLKELVEENLVGEFKQGRSNQFWARDTGLRPDLGMPASVQVATPVIDQAQVSLLAQTHLKSTMLGLGGPAETLVNVSLAHRLLYRVDFEERIEKGLLGRLVGASHENRLGSVYLHPRTLQTLTWDRARGLRFADKPDEHASDVHDLDGVVRFVAMPPAGLRLDDAEWSERKPETQVLAAFKTRWSARVLSVQPVFLPVWKALLRRHEPAGMRVVVLDAIAGHLLDWPG